MLTAAECRNLIYHIFVLYKVVLFVCDDFCFQRKQTCNEAEDTHVIRRNPSRHLRPLARSTSTESVVSLGSEKPQEQNVPVFTIENYRKEKRKSLR